MKKIFRITHQWLGLITGLLIFIIAITGCLYAFQEEVQNVTQPYRFIKQEDKPFLLPSKLEEIATKNLPGKKLHSISYFTEKKSTEAVFYNYNPTYYYKIYLNPYNGKILKIKNMEKGFFPFILKGHFYLWLPPKIGQPVVAISTLVFLLVLLSGIIVWFPKNRKALKNKVWLHWGKSTKWKRKNFDLHSVIGFYTFFIALIFITTGLVWGFHWFASGYYKTMGGKKELSYKTPVSKVKTYQPINGTDILFNRILSEKNKLKSIEVHPPENDSAIISINTNTEIGTYWKTDYRYYDQYSLQEIPSQTIHSRIQNAEFADKLFRMNYDIHTGAVLGLGGKVFMFLMSLLIASLPVTGCIIWYAKKRKRKVNL